MTTTEHQPQGADDRRTDEAGAKKRREPHGRVLSAGATVVVMAVFMLGVFVVSDAALTGSRAFWSFCRKRAIPFPTRPLRIEADLRLRAPDKAGLVFIGSSVVDADIDRILLARRMSISPGQIVQVALHGGNALELGMLTRDLIRARPRVVVYLATPWILFKRIDWDLMRFYDPAFALSLFTWKEFAAEHGVHTSGLLESSHVVIRRRASLRTVLFNPLLASISDAPLRLRPRSLAGLRRLRHRMRARSEDFGCPNLHTRALAEMAHRLTAEGISFAVVSTPINDRWQRDEHVQRLLDQCLGALAASGGFGFVSQMKLPVFEPHEFRDYQHMNSAGKRRFTAAVADRLSGPPARKIRGD